MTASEKTPHIVRRRSRHKGGGHHGGSWKIAYADFITAMMAFFLVMWLLSLVPKKQLTGLAEYFRMPLEVALQQGVQNNNSTTLIQGGNADPRTTQGETQRGSDDARGAQSDADRRDSQRLDTFRRHLDNVIEQSPRLKNYRPQLRIDVTNEGLRIQILDDRNRPAFSTGSAQVEPYMQTILRELGPVLNEVPNRISLSGHTDARPYSSGQRSYSNWELSADRANASRRELIAGGMLEDKVMRVVGMASSMPMTRDDEYADINRRISLVLLNRRTQRQIEEDNATAATSSRTAGSASGLRQSTQEAPRPAPEPAPSTAAEPPPTATNSP